MELSIYARVCQAVCEYEKLVRDFRSMGKTWEEFLEEANDDPVAVGYEIADMASDLFPELVGMYNDGELVALTVRMAQDWLKYVS
jgi:hypothetical protein